jgi:hypothetical protein
MIREQTLRARQKLVGKLPISGELLRGSLLERTVRHRKCCPKCARGEGHQVFVLTVTYPGGRTRQFSVRRERLAEVRRWFMIDMRRAQLSFGDGLIAGEVSDLREDWMNSAPPGTGRVKSAREAEQLPGTEAGDRGDLRDQSFESQPFDRNCAALSISFWLLSLGAGRLR